LAPGGEEKTLYSLDSIREEPEIEALALEEQEEEEGEELRALEEQQEEGEELSCPYNFADILQEKGDMETLKECEEVAKKGGLKKVENDIKKILKSYKSLEGTTLSEFNHNLGQLKKIFHGEDIFAQLDKHGYQIFMLTYVICTERRDKFRKYANEAKMICGKYLRPILNCFKKAGIKVDEERLEHLNATKFVENLGKERLQIRPNLQGSNAIKVLEGLKRAHPHRMAQKEKAKQEGARKSDIEVLNECQKLVEDGGVNNVREEMQQILRKYYGLNGVLGTWTTFSHYVIELEYIIHVRKRQKAKKEVAKLMVCGQMHKNIFNLGIRTQTAL
jgi:hypothetical protein